MVARHRVFTPCGLFALYIALSGCSSDTPDMSDMSGVSSDMSSDMSDMRLRSDQPADIADMEASVDLGRDAGGDSGRDSEPDLRPSPPELFESARQLAVGFDHNCAVGTDRRAYCWGGNASFALGDGTSETRGRAVPVQGLPDEDVLQVSVINSGSCALLASGHLWCWGLDYHGEDPAPAQILDLGGPVKEIVTHCALTQAGEVFCAQKEPGQVVATWLRKEQLGQGVVQIDGVVGSYCALKSDQSVWCWGRLLTGDSSGDEPVQIEGLDGHVVRKVSAGLENACAKLDTGGLRCWGKSNSLLFSSLGGNRSVAIDASLHFPAVWDVSARNDNVCAVTLDGGVTCTGLLFYEQRPSYQVLRVPDLPLPMVEVHAGLARHSCARAIDGSVYCWGWSGLSQVLGHDPAGEAIGPHRMQGLPAGRPKLVSVGADVSCVLMEDSGEVWCVGAGGQGELGNDPMMSTRALLPVQITTVPGKAIHMDMGHLFACAVLESGQVYCWGDQTRHVVPEDIPAGVASQVMGIQGQAREVSAGVSHACALTQGGEVWCWGTSRRGQLNGNSRQDDSLSGVKVELPEGATQIVAAQDVSCALTLTGEVWCWGDGHSEVEKLAFPSPAQQIDAGDRNVCALLDGGEVWCIGSANNLRRGANDMRVGRDEALQAELSGPAVEVRLNADYGCAQLATGEMECWGNVDSFFFGPRFFATPMGIEVNLMGVLPVAQEPLSGAFRSFDLSQGHGCGVKADDGIQCWGVNLLGQLGDGQHGQIGPVKVVGLR